MQKIKSGIRIFFLGYLIFALGFGPALADTAALLPPAVSQFFDNNGNPLTSGTVDTYNAGTSTRATTWKDSAEVNPNTNPIKLDAGGKAIIYGNQVYRTVVKDHNGNLIWDAVTAPGGGGGGTPTLVGDGNLVGTVLPWSGLVAPNQYVFGYGQEIARASFPTFFTAVTQQLNVICSASSNTLTGISDTTQIRVGEPIELALCVPAGTTVVSKTASTIVLSNPSNVSINATGVFFPWGNGNGTTTFNVPDFRGVSLVGRTNMGGTASTNLTNVGCPNISPDSLGATCGSQTKTLVTANLPAYTPSGTNSAPILNSGAQTVPSGQPSSAIASGASFATFIVANFFATTVTAPIFTGTAQGGTSTPFSLIQPIVTTNYIVKVTPDTSTSIATGVWSIGGMSGIIACGSGILCTGNIISSNGSPGGNINDIQFNYNNALGGNDNFQFISPDNFTLGAAGVTGKFDLLGSTSGKVRQVAQAIAGTPTVTWGTSSGTPAVTASAPLSLNTGTGNLIISGSALTKTDDTNVTLTLGGVPTAALISPASLTLGWTGQLAVGRGGTGLASGTSGGIPYFNSTTTIASSALLTTNQIMIGGGAGNPPTTFACATTTTVIHGGTPPTCGQIVNADITTNTISNNVLAQVGAATFKGNPTNSTATPTDFTIQGLTARGAPDATNDKIPLYDNSSGTIKYVTPGQVASSATAGVSSIAGNTGAFTLSGLLTNSTNVLQVVAAVKSDQVTGTSNVLAVTPAIQQAHGSAHKVSGKLLGAGAATLQAGSFNVSSVSRTSAGIYVINFTTAFAAGTYGCTYGVENNGGATAFFATTANGGYTTTSVTVNTFVFAGTAGDAVSLSFECFGAQ